MVLKWNIRKLSEMIIKVVSNKFDFFVIIEGNRGLGKSTLAYHLAKRVSRIARKEKIEGYRFNAKNNLLYKRQEVIRFLDKRKATGIADEMINVSFNRDFYNEDQKDLIKMLNMNRDHCNLFIACVPEFKNLDTQIKNLCKMRITVVRRGLAVVQTPNRSIYSVDKWDQKINEKIERKWSEKGIKHPRYSKLTTYRGMIKFPALSDKDEVKYQKVKDDKRHEIFQEKEKEKGESNDPMEIVYNTFIEKKIKNQNILEGYAMGMGLTLKQLQDRLKRRLKKDFKPEKISLYYYDPKAQREGTGVSEAVDKIFS